MFDKVFDAPFDSLLIKCIKCISQRERNKGSKENETTQ